MRENIIIYTVIASIFILLTFISTYVYLEDRKYRKELENSKEETKVVNKTQKKEFIESFFKKSNNNLEDK
ncbi:hypothetical protein AAX26_00890 [Aliarcobacter thereius]|uniref:Uncharacterized protein n=2 Tax=Aliarcobacter thereius TaxID=544718 RepID=A0A1C0B7T3_9BACT|nr:hypothetical protein [Aliarcobacter thereius]OCL87797.1 hypothetical protein AAX26_00890 [Aliarcobacter thereius]OCL94054.1 hypothetical protein AAX25_00381 [Aliarcobacter thereius]OCL95448.1 hypothetical protein AA347_00907 [Aliarcobacter thereius LMG 24486]OCL99658.1 hypothetical protein AAX29_00703 [Aliarcobacter thereius]QBF16564.1 hypothetical protein ATH_1538 [Aliarcobacter thereius LMG 24486]